MILCSRIVVLIEFVGIFMIVMPFTAAAIILMTTGLKKSSKTPRKEY
jgi:hypothetical protein